MASFMRHKEDSGAIEPFTARGYRAETRIVYRHLGSVRLAELSIPGASSWMRDMGDNGYAPESRSKALRLPKQAIGWAVAQGLISKNPCDFCKSPKLVKAPINALSREERTRMLRLAMEAEPRPLGLAAEIALTTGMGRGEACAPRWSDPSDGGTITVSRTPGDCDGGSHVKGPRTGAPQFLLNQNSQDDPPTKRLETTLSAKRRDAERETGVALSDPCAPGTRKERGLPRNPTRLGEDLSAFRRVSGLSCALHDPRRTLATMMIAGGCDVRTAASCLGHASASMAPDV